MDKQELIELMENYRMPYGKFKGESVGTLVVTERGYLEFLRDKGYDPLFKWAIAIYLEEK